MTHSYRRCDGGTRGRKWWEIVSCFASWRLGPYIGALQGPHAVSGEGPHHNTAWRHVKQECELGGYTPQLHTYPCSSFIAGSVCALICCTQVCNAPHSGTCHLHIWFCRQAERCDIISCSKLYFSACRTCYGTLSGYGTALTMHGISSVVAWWVVTVCADMMM